MEEAWLRLTRFPVGGEQLPNLTAGHRGQTAERIGQVFLRVDAKAAAALDEGIDHGATPTRVRVPDKEPAALADRRRSHVVFDQVGIDFEPPVPQIADQSRILIEQIADGFAQGALGKHPWVGPNRLGRKR